MATNPIRIPSVAVYFNQVKSLASHPVTELDTYIVQVSRSDGQPLATKEANWALRQSVFIVTSLAMHEAMLSSQEQNSQLAIRRSRAAKQDEKFQAILARLVNPLA